MTISIPELNWANVISVTAFFLSGFSLYESKYRKVKVAIDHDNDIQLLRGIQQEKKICAFIGIFGKR